MKSPCSHQVLNPWPSNPDLLWFAAIPSLQDLAIVWLHTVRPHSSGQYSGGPLCSSCQQAVWNTVKTFPEPVHLERVCRPSAWLTCSHSRARLWFLSAAPRVPNWFPIQAQCCLKSLWWWPTEVDNNGFRSEIRQISMFSRQDKQNFYGHWWEKNISCTRAVVFYILLQGYFSSIDYLLKFKFRLSLTLDVQSMMY